MGTSSSRRGKVTRKTDNTVETLITWASAKLSATRFYNGKGSFEIAMQKVILASGGREKFAGIKRVKKVKALHSLLSFFELAKTTNIREALAQNGILLNDTKSISDSIIEYVNTVVYPDAVSYSDTSNREELTRFALEYYALFDSNAMAWEENQAILNAISDIVCDDLVLEINNTFEEEIPLSLENEDVETTLNQIKVAKANIKNKVEKYLKIYVLISSSVKDIEEYEHNVYYAVLDDYLSGDYGNE